MTCSIKDLQKLSEIAKNEIGENKVDLAEAVDKVKALLSRNYPDLRLPSGFDGDNLVERCLRNRKFNQEKAANQVHSYFKLLSDLYKMHGKMLFLPSLHKEFYFDSMGFTVLKNRDSKGHTILMANFEVLPVPKYTLDDAIATNILLMDELTRNSIESQKIGIIYVCNFRGYEFAHAKQFTFSRIRAVARMIQGSFPVRYKAFHIVNAPAIFIYTYAIIKNFLREKIKSRVHFYGNDLTEFYKHVNPDILPDFMGGKLSYEESVDVEFTNRLVAKDDYYKDLFTYGYMRNEDSGN